ncbi:hypothetical protein ACJU26_09765 [Acidithiobacillus sp. M4-SHS-6]|uniref:hypothetical protein n=1 Tax=Acidithiobacillus sp. M4-SHS-6 TaxID=3383024 RepID=UPI0039BE1C94
MPKHNLVEEVSNAMSGAQRRDAQIMMLCEELKNEFARIEQDIAATQTRLRNLFGVDYAYVHYYPCGRDCRGCPHPVLARLPRKEPWVQAHISAPEYQEIRNNFNYLKRRRANLLKLTQTMEMSIFRLGGAAHSADVKVPRLGK